MFIDMVAELTTPLPLDYESNTHRTLPTTSVIPERLSSSTVAHNYSPGTHYEYYRTNLKTELQWTGKTRRAHAYYRQQRETTDYESTT